MSARAPCPVCGAADTRRFLTREAVPVHQNLLAPTRADALGVARGDLAFAACASCGFVFNEAFDASKLAYGAGYDNNQACSGHFARYLAGLAEGMVRDEGVTNRRIVEVGCGQGQFLRLLVEDPATGNTGVGFDPSYSGAEVACEGRLRFVRALYGPASGAPADVVVCRHVIEHVARPLELLRAVAAALAASREPRVFFETPDVEWILRNAVFWDFFYEHCSLFGAASLRAAFEGAGFAVDAIDRAFGGQYLWARAHPGAAGGTAGNGGEIVALAQAFARRESELRARWARRVDDLARTGTVAIWGAGAKGVTFAQLVDPRCELVDCLVDVNPNKQGKYAPGTGHPIVGPADLAARGVTHAILMNPNYRAENEALIAACGGAVRLVE